MKGQRSNNAGIINSDNARVTQVQYINCPAKSMNGNSEMTNNQPIDGVKPLQNKGNEPSTEYSCIEQDIPITTEEEQQRLKIRLAAFLKSINTNFNSSLHDSLTITKCSELLNESMVYELFNETCIPNSTL